MNYTYYGHSGFLLEFGATKILIDPFITPNPAASHIHIDSIVCSHILLSHGHADHVADAESIARKNNAVIVAAYEVAAWFGNKGLAHHPMNIGGNLRIADLHIKTVAAIHSSTLPDGSNGGNPMGFLLTHEGKTFYYSGDTALTMDMELIGKFDPAHHSFLCMGDQFTMGYEDAVRAAQMVKSKHVTAMHFDTFPPIVLDRTASTEAFEKAGISLTIPEIGRTYTL
jgi:L-ascorbate metabolism protein UlaG (beta-lactamase superfamily)